jgi:hypothetical protein
MLEHIHDESIYTLSFQFHWIVQLVIAPYVLHAGKFGYMSAR